MKTKLSERAFNCVKDCTDYNRCAGVQTNTFFCKHTAERVLINSPRPKQPIAKWNEREK